jgi:hypothetical protein
MPLADQSMTQQQYQTSLLEQLAQLQIRLANVRMDTRPNTRGLTTSGKINACRTEGCVGAPWAALTLRGCHTATIPSV